MTVAEELERLQALRERGAISEAEYAQAKARALGESPPLARTGSFLHRLRRSSTDQVLGGVCGGLGATTGLPSWAWRVLFCVAAVYFGIGAVLYLLLWAFIPAEPTDA